MFLAAKSVDHLVARCAPHKNMTTFRVAVAIPTYKRENLLRKLIASIPETWTICISDNGSSMVPLDIPLPGIVSHASSLIPMFANWNRALSLVPGDATHVFIPSDDDLFLPNAGEVVQRAVTTHPDADMFVFGCNFFDEHGHSWAGYCAESLTQHEAGAGFHVFARGVSARMPGVLLRKSFLDQIGGFDEGFELTGADSELIQRALLLGRTVFVPETIGLYRIWAGSLTHARVATDQWMREIDLWVDKVGKLLLAGHQPLERPVNIARYKDEIYIANLRSGIHALKRGGRYLAAWRHVVSRRYPFHASLLSQAKLLAHLLLPLPR